MTEQAATASDSPSPPYASASSIDNFFSEILTVKDPKKVDAEWAKKYDLDASLPNSIPTMLRWLGVVDDNYATVDSGLWNDIRLADSRPAALAKLVREAYAPVFDALDLDAAPRKQIEAVFARTYPSLGNPGRNVTCFLTLCRYADIAVAAGQRKRLDNAPEQRKKKDERSAPNRRASLKRSESREGSRENRGGNSSNTTGIAAQVSVNAEIPADWSPEQIKERLRTIAEALRETGLR